MIQYDNPRWVIDYLGGNKVPQILWCCLYSAQIYGEREVVLFTEEEMNAYCV
jgi:hypothetical protein